MALDSIAYQVVGSSDNALTAFRANSLDIATVSGDQVANAMADPDVSQALEVTGAGFLWYLTFSQTDRNAAGGKLANANPRLAISNAIDRESLMDNYVMDGSLATYAAVPPQFAASATTGEDFSGGQEMFADHIGYDVDRATKFFEDAKKELGTDTFTMIYGNNEGDEVEKAAQAIKEQAEKNLPGITLNLQPMTKAERLDRMLHDDFDVAHTRWDSTTPTP